MLETFFFFWSLSKCKCDENMFWCQNKHKTYSIVLMYIDFCGATYIRLQRWDHWVVKGCALPRLRPNENAGRLIGTSYSERKLMTVNLMQLKLRILSDSLISTACYISKCDKQINSEGPCTVPALHTHSTPIITQRIRRILQSNFLDLIETVIFILIIVKSQIDCW